MVYTKTMGKLIWNVKPDCLPLSIHVNFTRSRMTLVLLPPSIDDKLNEWKCWGEGMSEWSVRGCVCITGSQGCWVDAVVWLPGYGNLWQGHIHGLNTLIAGPQRLRRGNSLMYALRYKRSWTYSYALFIRRQFVSIDSLMITLMLESLTAFRRLI